MVQGLTGPYIRKILGNLASEKSHSTIITLFFRQEEFGIIFTQENGDLAVVGGDGGPCIQFPLVRSWEQENRSIVQILFNGEKI